MSVDHVGLMAVAPTSIEVTAYDQFHLLTYARMLDATDACIDWREAAKAILGPSVEDIPNAEACWISHLARARWINADGLARLTADT